MKNDSMTEKSKTGTLANSIPQNYRGFVEIVVIIVIAVVVALIVRMFLLQLFFIPSESMDPTLKVNDKIFVNKLA